MENFEIFIGTHGATTVIFFLADDMDSFYVKRVRSANDGANIKIAFEVLDGNFEIDARLCEGGKNLLVLLAFEGVDKIARVFHIVCIIT